jgi:hypothetical protein
MKTKICVVSIVCIFLSGLISPKPADAQGKVEVSFHMGSWSLNILKSLVEEELGSELEIFRNDMLDEIQSEYPDLEEDYYNQTVGFDASGPNFGFELRWYPKGHNGSFSLGLAVERTTMEIGFPNVSAELGLTDGSLFQADASGRFLIKPLAFLLTFRWDMWPRARLHPYFTFGVGGAAMGSILANGEASFSFDGTLNLVGGGQDQFSMSETRTFQEFKDDIEADGEDFILPGFFPFVQIHFGLKAVITRNIHIMADAGILDGFLIRGGLAFRF